FLGAEPVPGDVDDIVDAAEDAVITVLRLHRAVARHVRPVAPVLAFGVLAVTRVVHAHEAVRISPDGLHDAGPGIADADVARLARTGLQFLRFIVVDHRMDARDAGTRAARLHLVDSRHRAAEEAAGFRLPPGVHDHRLFLADDVEVPLPDLGFDGLADGCHVLEAVVVLSGLVRTVLAQRADRGGRGVENVYAELLGNAPGAARIRVRRHALVHDRRSGERERPVHDVGVSRDPADVRHAPIDILGMDVLYVLRSPGYIGEIAADRVLRAFGLTGGAAGVHEEQRRFRSHLHRVDALATVLRQKVVDNEIASFDELRLAGIPARMPLPDEHFLQLVAVLRCRGHRDVGLLLVLEELPAAVVGVHRDQHAALRVGHPVGTGLAAEAAEYLRVDDSEPRAGEHGNRQLRHHRHVQRDAVASLQPAEVAQQSGELVDPDVQFLVGDVLDRLVFRFRYEMDRGLVPVLRQMPIDAVVRGIDFSADEPAPERRLAAIEDLVPLPVPVEQFRELPVVAGELLEGEALEDVLVGKVGLRDELPGRGDVVLLLPVHGDLRLGHLGVRPLRRLAARPVLFHDDSSSTIRVNRITKSTPCKGIPVRAVCYSAAAGIYRMMPQPGAQACPPSIVN